MNYYILCCQEKIFIFIFSSALTRKDTEKYLFVAAFYLSSTRDNGESVRFDRFVVRVISMRKNVPKPQLEKIGEIVEKSLRRLDQSGKLTEYGVWPIWNETVGPTIARNAQPEKIRHATLFVKVTSPVWMQQLQYMKEMITDKLNERLMSPVVKNIFFFVGQIDTAELPPTKIEAPPADSAVSLPSPYEDDLQLLKDPEMRRAFRRLLVARSRKAKR